MRLTWRGKLIFRNKMRPQRQGPCSTVSMETGEDAREILVVTHSGSAAPPRIKCRIEFFRSPKAGQRACQGPTVFRLCNVLPILITILLHEDKRGGIFDDFQVWETGSGVQIGVPGQGETVPT